MYTKGFIIRSDGDPSVGIFPATWELTGGFYFDGKEDLELFRTKLHEAFEYAADEHYVETFEEIEEREKKINEQLKDYYEKGI